MTTTSSKFPSISKHNHCNDTDEPCDIYQEYADDLSAITTVFYNQKLPIATKDCVFNCYVARIFLITLNREH